MRTPFAGLLVAAGVAACLSCSSGKGSLGEVGTYDDGGAFAGGVGVDAGGSLRVAIAPMVTTLCPGQCVDLAATAVGGVAPYAYRWGGGLAGAATQHICPTVSTKYAVTATDSSAHGGELATAGAQASASATVTVTPTCTGGVDAGPIVTEGREICSATWQVQFGTWTNDGGDYSAWVATDAQGDMIVVTSQMQAAALVTIVKKFDPQCHELWTKQYASQANVGLVADVVPTGVAVDASSNIVVTGVFAGTVNFGDGALTSSSYDLPTDGQNSGFLLKLDPQGDTSWSKAFTSAMGAVFVDQGVVDPAGNIDIVAGGPAGVDFGGGALAVGVADSPSYVVQFGPDGTYRFGKALVQFESSGIATNATGAIWVTGSSLGTSVVWDGTSETVDPNSAVVAEFSAGGAYLWGLSFAATANNNPISSVVTGGSGDAFVAIKETLPLPDGGTCDCSDSRAVASVGPGGAPRWADVSTFAYEPSDSSPQWLALDASEDVLVGGAFQGTFDWGGLTLTSAGDADIYVAVLDASGRPRAAARWGGSEADQLSAIAADPSGNAVAVGLENGPPFSATITMFIAKLGL